MRTTMTDRVMSATRFVLIAIVVLPLAASCSVDQLLKSGGTGGDVPVDPQVSPAKPESAGQFRSDGVTPIQTGETVSETGIVIAARLSDPEPDDSLRLQLELRPVGFAFTGFATHGSGSVGNGERATINVQIAETDTAYIWQVRSVDRAGRTSGWVLFNTAGGAFRFAMPRVPAPPIQLAQYEANGETPIPVGGTVDERDVFLRARIEDPRQTGELRLDFEVRAAGVAFTGAATHFDNEVRSGQTGSVKFRASAFTGYRWQSRVCRDAECSPWVEFGGNAPTEQDFFRDPFEDDAMGISAEPRRP